MAAKCHMMNIREATGMNDSSLSSSPQLSGFRDFPWRIGQRVRVIRGPLQDLQGVVASTPRADQVLVSLRDKIPGVCIQLSPLMLEAVEQ